MVSPRGAALHDAPMKKLPENRQKIKPLAALLALTIATFPVTVSIS
jgi:hypothetical protein